MKLVKNIKPSTIKLMFKEERGLASIVIVSVLIVLISLISLGFARIMNRTISNSSNHALSAAATYAAQSALNDVASYIKTNSAASSDKCSGPGSLIGDAATQGPFYNDSDLSADGSRSTQLTCLLLDQTPGDLVFQNNTEEKSRIVRLDTTAAEAKILVSWQASDSRFTKVPPGPKPSLYDQTTWNNPANGYIPILRLVLYPATSSGSIANMETDSRTIFLYPDDTGGHAPLDYTTIQDGHIYTVNCDRAIQAGSFNGTPDYSCNLVISNLLAASSPSPEYFYVRLTPIYNKLDIKIKANDAAGNVLSFQNVQALVDVTTQSGGVSKRLQARLNISNTSGSNYDVAPDSDAIPEQSIRSANTLCKRYQLTGAVLSIDDISGKCLLGSNITFTPPTVTLTASPTTITSGQSSTLTWVVANATSCTASNAWSGSKDPNGNSQSTGALSTGSYTYTIICSGLGGASAPSSATVTVNAPPPPPPPPPPGGSNACAGSVPDPSNPFSEACMRGFTFKYWSGDNAVFGVFASHCYISLSINGTPISWNRSPSDNSDWYDYSIPFSGSGGTATATCVGNGSSSLSAYVSPKPVPPIPPVCTPCPFGGCAETGCNPAPPCLKGCP